MRILLAEDEAALRHALTVLLERNCYTVDAVDNGQDALEYLRTGDYGCAVLDVMMPRLDGFSVVRQLRQEKNPVPVLLLTARSDIEDRVEGLDAGANDYLSKPFDIRELLARLRVLTRTTAQRDHRLQLGDLTVNTAEFTLSGPKTTVQLTNKEFQCLQLLLSRPGHVVPADRFLESVWNPEDGAAENTLWTVIYNLRKKLEAVGAEVRLVNKRNLGYALEQCL